MSAVTPVQTHDVTARIDELLRAHALETHYDSERAVVEAEGVAVRARAFDRDPELRARLQLDVTVFCPARLGAGSIVESFAGAGATFDEALSDALVKFRRATLHVILSALVRRDLGFHEVQWETWSNDRASWDVCLGPLFGFGHPLPAFSDILDDLKRLFLAEDARGPHWLRVFRMSHGNTAYPCEALLDNDPWPRGMSAVDSHAWPPGDGLRTMRHFLIAIPSS